MIEKNTKKSIFNKTLIIIGCIVLAIVFSFGVKTVIDYKNNDYNEERNYGDTNGCKSYNGNICIECAAGYYQTNYGATGAVCTVCPSDKYCPGGTSAPRTLIAKPTSSICKTGLVYNGYHQTIASAGTGYSLTGHSVTDAGSHTVTAKLAASYAWSDKTLENVTFECSIAKATPTVTISNTSKVYDGNPLIASVAVAINGNTTEDLEITIPLKVDYYSDTSCGTKMSGAPTEVGNYSIKVTATATNNTNSKVSGCTQTAITDSSNNDALMIFCDKIVTLGNSGSCRAYDDNDNDLTDKVTWNSAAVGLGFSNGKFTPTATGEFTVSASYNGLTAYETINVVSPSSFDLVCSDNLISKGGTTTCISKFNGNSVSATYESNDTSVITIDTNGKVTGVKAGSTTIKATYTYNSETYTDTYAITVSKSLKSLTVEPKSATIQVGESVKITKAVVTYDDGTTEDVLDKIQIIGTTNVTSPAQATLYGAKVTPDTGDTVIVKYIGNDIVGKVVVIVKNDVKYNITLNNNIVSLAKNPDTFAINGRVTYTTGNATDTFNEPDLKLKFSTDLAFVDETIKYNSNGTFTATFTAKTTEAQSKVKICIDGTNVCTEDITVKVHCNPWTVVNSQKEWSAGRDLGHAHVTLSECNYVNYSSDCTLKAGTTDTYVCTKYYNRCCGDGGGGSTTEACYKDANNNYKWATSAPSGYTLVSGVNTNQECAACFKNDKNDYKWAKSQPSGYTLVPNAKEADCKYVEKEACYENKSSGVYVWGLYEKDNNYQIVSGVGEDDCKTPSGTGDNTKVYACYKNSSNDYKWAETAPSGYTLVESIKEEVNCKVSDTSACYSDANGRYVWGNYANNNSYKLISTIKSPETCVNPSACYKDKNGDFVWGNYSHNSAYTLIANIDSQADCTSEEVKVPSTGASTAAIIYVAIVTMIIFGGSVVYYVYTKKKLG